ncbi:MAG TPA: bifunctional diaminohydroxyphosphoribosylaminopyrimidine deaminase/5-amino-6-(5-phosphoribosylamino)uracil reductase RibD [Pseudacidobacterium sp.]|nr:bifunctional diaminohydroxyphosphoribosylaminopyrimidine deaminase/5-amino-6-(5-phosphoribosylamino)uracil reductase RibD [Pseudacidobacterium sp.]
MQDDIRWMKRALALAQQSVGVSSPNPAVGCVLVQSDGSVVGEGFHKYEEFDHAEIVALKQAGEKARGATAYVTLEPCSHRGRTGPCADALIHAGIARVVAATGDPNPAVNGQGIEKLRKAGIPVDVGVLCDEARAINDGFAKYIRTGLPFVTLKAGVSLDGRIAPAPGSQKAGKPYYITSEMSRFQVQQMRHACDAIITGIGTVLADDPQLTDRSGCLRRQPLLRVVLDSSLRLLLNSKLVQTAKEDVLVFCTSAAPAQKQRELEARGVRVEQVPECERRVSLEHVLRRLGELQVLSAMLEGGAQLNTAAMQAQIADKLCFFYAPQLLGENAVPLFAGSARIQPEMQRISWKAIGNDALFEAYLRDPWK